MEDPTLKDDPLAWLQATNALGKLNRTVQGHKDSKHIIYTKHGKMRATKRYADGRQKPRPKSMRKRRH